MTERTSNYGVVHPNRRITRMSEIDNVPGYTRQSRFAGMLGLYTVKKYDVLICGCGAIGRQVALTLATMDIAKSYTLVDPDVVDGTNLGTQGFGPAQLGKSKVVATKDDMLLKNPGLKVHTHTKMMGVPKRVGAKNHWKPAKRPHILFLCPDDMITRNEFKADKDLLPTKFLIDTRMGAWACRIISDVPPFKRWIPTLFSDSASFSGSCTLQSTFFAASVCSGLAVASLMDLVGAVKPDPVDVIVNLLDIDTTHQEPNCDKKESSPEAGRARGATNAVAFRMKSDE